MPVITSNAKPPVNRPFTIAITWSEPVRGFTVTDLRVKGGRVSEFEGTGAVYTVLITPTRSGELTIDIRAGTATDNSGQRSAAAQQFSIRTDDSGPTGQIRRTDRQNSTTDVLTGPFDITITFNEPVFDFTLHDLVLTMSLAEMLDGVEAEYTAVISPEGPGISESRSRQRASTTTTATTTSGRSNSSPRPTPRCRQS